MLLDSDKAHPGSVSEERAHWSAHNSYLIANWVQLSPVRLTGTGTVLLPLLEEWTSFRLSFPSGSFPMLSDRLSCLLSGLVRLNRTPWWWRSNVYWQKWETMGKLTSESLSGLNEINMVNWEGNGRPKASLYGIRKYDQDFMLQPKSLSDSLCIDLL